MQARLHGATRKHAEVSVCSPKRAGRPRLGEYGVQGLQARSWCGTSDGRRVWGANWSRAAGSKAPLAENASPSGVLAPPGSAPGVPLRSPAAEAVAALPGAVDEALSVFAFLLDGGVQNGLVQKVNLKHTRGVVRTGTSNSRFSLLKKHLKTRWESCSHHKNGWWRGTGLAQVPPHSPCQPWMLVVSLARGHGLRMPHPVAVGTRRSPVALPPCVGELGSPWGEKFTQVWSMFVMRRD